MPLNKFIHFAGNVLGLIGVYQAVFVHDGGLEANTEHGQHYT